MGRCSLSRRTLRSLGWAALLAGALPTAWADAGLVAESPGAEDFILVSQGRAAPIYVDAAGDKAVVRAAGDWAADVARVTGLQPAEVTDRSRLHGEIVLVGALGESPVIDGLAATGKLDVRGVQGEWESSVTQVVRDPLPGVTRALVIAGSDRRGAIYGLYNISEAIGVSPWYWWADVPVRHRAELAIAGGVHQEGPSAVKYRGIFLNDEDWGLQPWAAKTFDPATGDIGPQTYARIFELLLRLHANYLWPAMHDCTHAFNYYPDDKVVADDYGIVMGSSHCEQMLRDNVDEWPRDGQGEYNYKTNRAEVLKYWEARVQANGRFENVYTVGMRGISDGAMPGGGTLDEKADRMRHVIADQRALLARWVNPDPARVPQIFCPYKEVLDISRRDPSIVPDDITLLWPDDNYGYVRQYSDARERRRAGGAGVYYHVSYWGAPYDYLWLCSTPPGLIWEEMTKAWRYGAQSVWILNVGDLKPAEIDIEFFLKLARDPGRWTGGQAQNAFLAEWAARDFGPEHAYAIAALLDEYYRLNFSRKPEHMGLDAKNRQLAHPAFSPTADGDEAQTRLRDFADLRARAEAVANLLTPEQRAAYYQLVLYPVRGAALANEKGLNLGRYFAYAQQGRAAAGEYLAQASRAQAAIAAETDYYNGPLSGGKWRLMMSDAPRAQSVFGFPSLTPPPVPAAASLGLAPEGAAPGAPAGGQRLPQFSFLTQRRHFVDVFNRGHAPLAWDAQASAKWIQLSQPSGQGDERVWVSIDWYQAPREGDLRGTITFRGAGQTAVVEVNAYSPADSIDLRSADFAEDDGRVVLEADGASHLADGREGAWTIVSGVGYAGRGLTLLAKPEQPPGTNSGSARLEYKIWLETPGDWQAVVRTLPTWPITPGHPDGYIIALDDGPASVVSLPNYTDEHDPQWQQDVLRDAALTRTTLHVATAGLHTLKIEKVAPGIVLDAILLNHNPADPGYAWQEETRTVEPLRKPLR
jgi:hypothetical protein